MQDRRLQKRLNECKVHFRFEMYLKSVRVCSFFSIQFDISFFSGPDEEKLFADRFKFFFLLNGPYDLSPGSWRIDLPQSEDFLVIQVFSHRRVWFFLKSDFSWGDRIRRLYHPEGKKPRNFYTDQWFSAANVAKSRFWRPWFSEGRIAQSAFNTEGKFPANSSAQFMTNIFYYKEVNCSQSQVMQVLTEAEKLLPGN